MKKAFEGLEKKILRFVFIPLRSSHARSHEMTVCTKYVRTYYSVYTLFFPFPLDQELPPPVRFALQTMQTIRNSEEGTSLIPTQTKLVVIITAIV